ncbi:MAG: tRNA (adenosine(37)-N6)-threonylcarbamoyltransferase complex dimerization subunit type 1 TsaB [Phycisphaeraceae bacterium]|nr:tRNA (adenosine(37)-N6)-threonylcarbamoyltransferase complex dimerization subunit type 1 TsaB [Phycisphaeraceae bacterium]
MHPDSLAIETSTRTGSISIGCGDQLLQTVQLDPQGRHNLDLMPAVARLCLPNQLKQVYLDIGPGSFTGLRIAVTCAKMLAATLGVKLVAVEAVDVLAAQASDVEHLAVCVNLKRDTVYARCYQFGQPAGEAELIALSDLLEKAPRPLSLLGKLPADFNPPQNVALLPEQTPRSDTLWRIARKRAVENQFADPATILPRYARPPEAVTLWQQKNNNR